MFIRKAWIRPGMWLEFSIKGAINNPNLVLVHELGSNLRQFDLQQQFFSKDHCVLLLSLRGHGHSSTPIHPSIVEFTVRELAKDVRALLSQLGMNEVHYVGNGLGGLIGYELMDLEPDLLLSLTTFGTIAEFHTSRLALWSALRRIQLMGLKGWARIMKHSSLKSKVVEKDIKQLFTMVSNETLELITRNTASYDYTGTILGYDIPMMLIKGAMDREVNKKLGSTIAVCKRKPSFKFVELSGAGHYANLERPAQFNQVLLDFLESVEKQETPSLAADKLRRLNEGPVPRKSA